MSKNLTVVLLLVLAAGCGTKPPAEGLAPPLDPSRKVSEHDCRGPFETDGGNLLCIDAVEVARLARIAEEERQARARREAEERAERERLERERAEQLAREEAERKRRAAEEERLAAERRRLEAEAARKAQEELERQQKAEAEARARREAAERECRRLEQVRNDGRALLERFVAGYGQTEEFKGIAGQISAFLNRTRTPKPCP